MNIKYSRSLHYSPDNVLTVPYVPMETKRTLVTTNDEEAKQTGIDTELPEISSTASVPPPPPVHRPSPMPREIPEDDEDVVSETSDCSMVIRMAPHTHGEALLSVELKPSEGPEAQ
ncbi:hypothetical protein ANANG_G00210680 [Anguilla anguilla]|uniref:Uncharacterized protein n=1 Tax=Anguilla anguilla TaxID=7936 RepID=A0A9D3LZN1_ANGAN|nr:hypothetical protein ANANG_G00210680 [Anguilla anguilla]